MAFGVDDAVAITTIAAGVVGILAQAWDTANNVITNISSEKVNRKYRELSAKLADAMKKNSVLRDKITNAYNARNTQLLSNIVYSNPIGAAFNSAQDQLRKMNADYKQQMADITAKDNEINKAQNTMASAVQSGSQSFLNKDNAIKTMEVAAAQAVNGGLKENG